MLPAARYQAAIEILDTVRGGQAAEKVLTGWARRSRFAGSKDRAAIRDIVFDILRTWRSCAARGGGEGGRALVLGHLRGLGQDPLAVFTGVAHAPPPLCAEETAGGSEPVPGSAADLNCPDWLLPHFQHSLGAEAEPVLRLLCTRAPVHLRVNLARIERDAARQALRNEGIESTPSDLSPSALVVDAGGRGIKGARCYLDGLVELQDAASQAVADLVPLAPGERLLDFCAGGGGKALAIAARVPAELVLHDRDPRRMRDAPERAARAGVRLRCVSGNDLAGLDPFPVVLVDAPCSGSGAWRRQPEGKWRLSEADLAALNALQDQVLDAAAAHVVPAGGRLVYATCSVLEVENMDRVAAFLDRHPTWRCVRAERFSPLSGGDGFFCAILETVTGKMA